MRNLGVVKSGLGSNNNILYDKSLVDYFNFKDKSNLDEEKNIVYGVKGTKLKLNNFKWKLMSGYDGYAVDFGYFTDPSEETGSYIKTPFSLHITNVVAADKMVAEIPQLAEATTKAYTVKITGLKSGQKMYIGNRHTPSSGDAVSNKGMTISKDGVYNISSVSIPAGVTSAASSVIMFSFSGPTDILIEQQPLYDGSIVLNGNDCFIEYDKKGYDIGTFIIRFKKTGEKSTRISIMDIVEERQFVAYTGSTLEDNFNGKGTYKGFNYFVNEFPKRVNSSMFIGCSSLKEEYANIAIYDIAIYKGILSGEEIRNKIDKMLEKEKEDVMSNNMNSILKRIHPSSSYEELESSFSSLGGNYNTLFSLANTLKTFIEGTDSAATTINRWKELEDFLNGITDTQTLTGLLNSLKQEIKAEVTTEIGTAKAEAIKEAKSYTDEKVAAITPPST